MTGTAAGDFGTTTNQTQVALVDATHALAAGLTGTVSVVTTASSFSWGKPNANAAKIAALTSDATRITIFGYETAAAMPGLPAPGLPAPARRVGFFLSDTNGVSLTANGVAPFDAAIKWATANRVAPDAGNTDARRRHLWHRSHAQRLQLRRYAGEQHGHLQWGGGDGGQLEQQQHHDGGPGRRRQWTGAGGGRRSYE